MRVVIIGATPHSLVNFRGELMKAFIASGCEVIAMAGEATEQEVLSIEAIGAKFQSYPVSRNSTGLLNNLKTFFAFRKILNYHKPDVVLSYTIKPVIWTGIALFGNNDARFNALVTGLGYAFEGQGFKREVLKRVVSLLYRLSLKKADKVIFQNEDDKDYFLLKRITQEKKVRVVNGSGVPINFFAEQPFVNKNLSFLMIARLLNEKGVRYYVDAAKIVKEKYPETIFNLLGPYDSSPDAISFQEVTDWVKGGEIDYLGESNDVRPFLKKCDVFVLPSYYREGLPRTILEAMSTGRPILTTDNVGCREPIINGLNGWLVPIKDSVSLAKKMIWYIENKNKIPIMGKESRKIVEEKYDVNLVNKTMCEILGIN
tara:strand:- start:2797 stop:3912 length:1116 start_codon:yes stop_codon:yes gene_type:complete